MTTNHLQKLFEHQKDFMIMLGNNPDQMEKAELEDHISTMAIALGDEAFEILHETNWKPWKKPKEVNSTMVQEEIVDALHFVLELAILSGMTWENMYDRYVEKMAVNIKRQENGY